MSSSAVRIVLIDELVAKPGQGEVLLQAYLQRYAPGLQSRGFVLMQKFVSPCVWLSGQSNVLLFQWAIEGGAAAWWQARIASGRDPAVEQWWREVDELIVSRSRRFLCDADDIGRLTDV